MSYTIIANASYTEGVEAIIFDSLSDISEQQENAISSYAIETKKERSDNVFAKNNNISITGTVQNSPLPNVFGNTSQDNLLNSGEDRISKARNLLESIRDNGTFFTLVLKYKTYENCLIKNLTFQKTPETSSQLNFTIEIVSVRSTETATVTLTISKAASSISDDVANNTNTGNNNKLTLSGLTRFAETFTAESVLDETP